MKTVLTYGTFDLFHIGHHNILKRAKALGDKLIVGVTGAVYDFERGKMEVNDSLETRIANVKKTGFADEVFVEEYLGQKISDVLKYNADVLVIGSDWVGKLDYLKRYCDVAYLERTKDISSSQLRSKNILKIGIITDDISDNLFFAESHYLSTIHPQAVFSPNRDVATEFAKKNNMDCFYGESSDDFFADIDAVYIKSKNINTLNLLEESIRHKVHIITEKLIKPPQEIKKISDMAEASSVAMIENMKVIYSRNWEQLVWMVNSNAVGNIKTINISMKDFEGDIRNSIILPIYLVSRLLGENYLDLMSVSDAGGGIGSATYFNLVMKYDGALANIQISQKNISDEVFEIIGDSGKIISAGPILDFQYFEVRPFDKNEAVQRFAYNISASALRHTLLMLRTALKMNDFVNRKFLMSENLWLMETLAKLSE